MNGSAGTLSEQTAEAAFFAQQQNTHRQIIYLIDFFERYRRHFI
jgi:hypothetical protein